jgi:single-stranded-DNA-specific exonuclease
MKNLDKVAAKLKEAENIILYSDSDLDGITSALIAKKTLEEIGKKPKVFFANRKRGYGLNPVSVDMLASEAPGVLVTMDCGISNFEGVKKAKKLGFEVFILDHHMPHERLPEADLIVCPKLHDDDFKERPNAGIILELSKLILKKERKDFYEFTALAILGDMMPQVEINKVVLKKAKKNFPVTQGVKVFKEFFDLSDFNKLTQKIVPVLNITDFVSNTPQSFIYFSTEKKDEQKEIAKNLVAAYKNRKQRAEEIKQKIINEDKGEVIIFEGSTDWPSFLLGKIASRVLSQVEKPVFLYRNKGDISQGTVRVPRGFDAVEAMKISEAILENYGGHPPAAGFTIKNNYLEEFKNNLVDYFSEKIK